MPQWTPQQSEWLDLARCMRKDLPFLHLGARKIIAGPFYLVHGGPWFNQLLDRLAVVRGETRITRFLWGLGGITNMP